MLRTLPLLAFALLVSTSEARAQTASAQTERSPLVRTTAPKATPTLDEDAWVYCYWPKNFRPWPTWPAYSTERYVNSGHYGLVFDVTTGAIARLGALSTPGGPEAGLMLDNAAIEALPGLSTTYGVEIGGADHPATTFHGPDGDASNTSQLIDGGRFMHRLDIPEVGYLSESTLAGALELALMPRHFALTHRVESTVAQSSEVSVRAELAGAALDALSEISFIEGDRAVRMTDPTGDGWVFIVPEVAGTTARIEITPTGALVASRTAASLSATESLAVSLIGIPTDDLSDAQLQVYLHPGTNVEVRYVQKNREGQDTKAESIAAFDPERGVYVVELAMLTELGAPAYPDMSDPEYQTWYNRHRVVIVGPGKADVEVPLALDLEPGDFISYVTGSAALFRDANGEPTGLPLQISKNWHEVGDYWYHFYSTPRLTEGGRHELEFTTTTAKWGSVFAASHAQLSLIGWGTNQQWDESALGCWGESITYDPDLTLQRSMVDDVRPFLVQSNALYNWTGNVGGAQFLTYWPKGAGPDRLSRLRTHYAAHGPNLTDVTYAGKTLDGKIEGIARTRLGRTDDVVRALYDVEYRILEEVSYNRIAFFQVAADNYSDNDFVRLAWGNAAEVTANVPSAPTGIVGYASNADRGVKLEGEAPWVLLHSNQKIGGSLPEEFADVGFIVRDYELDLGDSVETTPHINFINTNNWEQYPEVGFELGVPFDATDMTLPAGARLRATIEYVVIPNDKSRYYGPSADLTAIDASVFGTPEMMRLLADGNRTDVEMQIGTLLRTHPIEIETEPVALGLAGSSTAARFEVTGGFGYVPLVFHGLERPDGWRLERLVGSVWEAIGQEVEGNDHWQAGFDPSSAEWTLTFNVDNTGTEVYRLVR